MCKVYHYRYTLCIIEVKEKTMYHAESKELLEYAKKQLTYLLIKKKNEGYSQSYLAKMLKLSQPTISRYSLVKERSGSKPALSLSKILDMIQLLGIRVVIDTREREIEKIFQMFDITETENVNYKRKKEDTVFANIKELENLSPTKIDEVIKEAKKIKQIKIKKIKELKQVSLYQKRRDLLDYAKEKLAMILKKKKEQGLSQTDLAEMLAVEPTRISILMRNEKKVTLSLVIDMMEQLGYYAVIDMREIDIEKRFKIFDRRSFDTLLTREIPLKNKLFY